MYYTSLYDELYIESEKSNYDVFLLIIMWIVNRKIYSDIIGTPITNIIFKDVTFKDKITEMNEHRSQIEEYRNDLSMAFDVCIFSPIMEEILFRYLIHENIREFFPPISQ